MDRKPNIQTLAWLFDIYKRGGLDMDPPYQRRSVWTDKYRAAFVDTILNGYPSPSIFLYKETSPTGKTRYSVVDGKQRLSTAFGFVTNRIAVPSSYANKEGVIFKNLSDDEKRAVWDYQFLVEYIPSKDESILSEIFNRINRNVSKLTRQELRHAQFDGLFAQTVEELTEHMLENLPKRFPNFADQSKRQMKDTEFVVNLLVYLTDGVKSLSQDDLDEIYGKYDEHWDARQKKKVVNTFTNIIDTISTKVLSGSGEQLKDTRARNQADFYSLFAAVSEICEKNIRIAPKNVEKLAEFLDSVDDAGQRKKNKKLEEYYNAARSASNDPGSRKIRIDAMKNILLKGRVHG